MTVAVGQKVLVGIGEVYASADAERILVARNLGSAAALALRDREGRAAGLLHWMLPDSGIDPGRAGRTPGLFLDSGLKTLLSELEALGVRQDDLHAVIAGAASLPDGGAFDVGARNREAVHRLLDRFALRVALERTGGTRVRELSLTVGPGEPVIREIGL